MKATTFLSEFRGLVRDLKDLVSTVYAQAHANAQEYAETDFDPLRPRKLRVVIAQSVSRVGQGYHAVTVEAQFMAVAVYEGAHAALQHLNETEIAPLREAVGEEWRALASVVAEDEGLIADGARAARDAMSAAATQAVVMGKKAAGPIRNLVPKQSSRSTRLSFQAVGRALSQAKDLVFSADTRSRQFDEMDGGTVGSARSQIAIAEQTVNRYLRVAASSVAVATVGTLFFAPLKLVSGVMILYAAIPVFKGAYTDLWIERRISVKLLDSVSFIGLLAGGYFLICSLTSTIFHASTKMMLKTEDRSRQMLANLFGEQPQTVWVVVDGVEIEIPFEQLSVGDTLVVHAGQMIPIDGVITAGTAAIDQHVLTGEAQPAEKGPGDRVFAATVLLAGRIEALVEKAGSETAAAQIRDLLANTTDFRTAIQARWRHVADRTVLPTFGLAGLGLATLGPLSALAVVNSNYVAVMKVASPLGMLNFLQRASQAGILIKDGRALEAASKVDTVVFDKTGTLTETQPHVGEIYPCAGFDTGEVLACAASVEAKQSHPIAQAILRAAAERNLALTPLEEERYEMGYGIEARVEGRRVRVGSARYMTMEGISLPGEFEAHRLEVQARGASLVFVAIDDTLAGGIELRPTLRPEAKQVVHELRERGLTIYIISGDHPAPTQALAAELGIDHYLAEVLPQDKSREVEKLQKAGRRVCFVGDGINDAIALKKANVSVSLRGASSLATNTAQIILMDESLKQLGQLFEVAGDYNANLKTLMTTTFGPGLVSLAAVFFFGAGNATALTLFNLSMVAGLVNGIWPALQQQQQVKELAGTTLAGGEPYDIEPSAEPRISA